MQKTKMIHEISRNYHGPQKSMHQPNAHSLMSVNQPQYSQILSKQYPYMTNAASQSVSHLLSTHG